VQTLAGDRRRRRTQSAAAALLLALLFSLFVIGRGPGTLVWLTGRPPSWLPFAGSGLSWLPYSEPRKAPAAAVVKQGASPLPAPAPTLLPTPDPQTPPAALPVVPAPTPVVPAPTPVPTRTATPAPEPTPRPVVQPTATPTPSPPSSYLFKDNFEQDAVGSTNVPNWNLDTGNWQIAQDGSHVLYTPDANWAVATVGSGGWTNIKVSATVKAASTTGHARLITRYSGGGDFYACGIDHGGFLTMWEVSGSNWTQMGDNVSWAFNPANFYSLSFTVIGSSLSCTVTDPSGALQPAGIQVSNADYTNGHAGVVGEGPGEFDNFVVTAA